MNDITLQMPPESILNIQNETIIKSKNNFMEAETESSINKDLIDELGKDVFDYLESMETLQDDNIILITPGRHYLYSSLELKKVKTIINIKELNTIRQANTFLHNFNRVLPMQCYFVGKFTDYKDLNEQLKKNYPIIINHFLLFLNKINHKLIPMLPVINWIQYLFNGRKLCYLTVRKVKKTLFHNGFHFIDVKQINGVTYFVSKKFKHMKKNRNSSIFNFVNDLYYTL